jgi:hypothetical protein
MKKYLVLFSLLFCLNLFAGENVELKAKFLKDNDNYIYLESKETVYKLIKKELTEDGVAQILKNKEHELTLFVPSASIKSRTPKKK